MRLILLVRLFTAEFLQLPELFPDFCVAILSGGLLTGRQEYLPLTRASN